jgi:hypothetical protein
VHATRAFPASLARSGSLGSLRSDAGGGSRRGPRTKRKGAGSLPPQIPEILETKEKRAYFFFAAGFFAAGFLAAFFAAFLAAAMVLTPPFGRWIDRTRAAC